MKRIAIIHPWMPQYRTKFFAELVRLLSDEKVQVEVFFGQTPPEWVQRNDSVRPSGLVEMKTRFFTIGGRVVSLKSLKEFKARGPYDLVILEQAIRNLETYRLLAMRSVRPAIAYWGHGKTYTVGKSGLEESFKMALTRRSRWFFGYTQGGVDAITVSGYSRERTTVVQNSTDTEQLRADLSHASEQQVLKFRVLNDLTDDTCLYIGGIDAAKRIPFLLEAAAKIFAKNSNFRLVIVGAGEMSSEVSDAARRLSYIVYVGVKFGVDKAIAMRACKLMLIPGRVGLVAVDSLVSGVPIVTTEWPYHAPEFEYLVNGKTMVVTSNDVELYAESVLGTLADPNLLAGLIGNCLHEGLEFSAEVMAERFAKGVLLAINGPA